MNMLNKNNNPILLNYVINYDIVEEKKRGVKNMIAIGCDHGGFKLKEEIKKYFDETDISYEDCGCYSEESVHYPDIAKNVSEKVSKNECDKGILICRSGIGMSIVANKFKGVRCAKVNSQEEAKFSRMHNDSNILALGADYNSVDEIIRIIRVWIATDFEGGRHKDRVDMIKKIENENMK